MTITNKAILSPQKYPTNTQTKKQLNNSQNNQFFGQIYFTLII